MLTIELNDVEIKFTKFSIVTCSHFPDVENYLKFRNAQNALRSN